MVWRTVLLYHILMLLTIRLFLVGFGTRLRYLTVLTHGVADFDRA